MSHCAYDSPGGCGRVLIHPEFIPGYDRTIKYFYKETECKAGHTNFICIKCGLTTCDVGDLYGHALLCCCEHTVHFNSFYTGCQIYETREIKEMIELYHEKKGKYLLASDINLYVSSHRMRNIFPQFIYLRRNEEMFKRMDISNIYLCGCYIGAGNAELWHIVRPVETISDTVKSIMDEMMRCSYGLEFQCSISGCEMVYDSLPSKSIIDEHCVVQHCVVPHCVVQHCVVH